MKVRVTYELDIPECSVAEAQQLVFDELVLTSIGAHQMSALDYEAILASSGIEDAKLLQEASKSARKWANILRDIKTIAFELHLAPLE